MDGWKNQLYFGDNLAILQSGAVPVGSVDLVYLDPPFNSNATYNILFAEKSGEKSAAQITAFEDTWHWGTEAAAAYDDVMHHGPRRLADLLQALRAFLGQNDMMAYLAMMAVRLVELHRVLKPTGSLFLHCDPTASHYLKLILDAVFGANCYRTEIIWSRSRGFKRSSARRFPHKHDTIFFYCKDPSRVIFNAQYRPHKAEYIKRFKKDANGRLYRDDVNPTGGGRRRIYLDEVEGDLVESTWYDIAPLNPVAKERLGYPTQKPEALLERIIRASSNEGDLVLDPFCGCGTTVTVAERLKRRWMGIDITHLAITLIKKRLNDTFGSELAPFEVIGEPADAASAAALAEENRHQFEWWALGLVDAAPAQDKKKGADRGVDGVIYFQETDDGPYHKIIVQVKSGQVGAKEVRELEGTRRQENAAIAALLTLKPPTRAMREAVPGEFYAPEHFPERRFPRLQILTIAELFAGQQLEYPRWVPPKTFKRAARRRKNPSPAEQQRDLL
jgi:site-specific DNA-methyltransferase (adenine-specific)